MFTISTTTRRALVIAAAIGSIPAASMAQAAKAELTGNDMATASGAQAAAPSTNARVKVYCAGRTTSGDTEVTGSLLKRKVCKTREQWLADGVKIDEGK